MFGDYFSYIFYAIGIFAVFYTLLILFQHAMLFYIVRTLKGLLRFVKKEDKYEKKDEPLTDREDELKRDQEVEIFKQQASEIRKNIAKKKDDGIIEVDVERFGGDVNQGFGTNVGVGGGIGQPRLAQSRERIVGVVDQNSLPKWQKMVFQKMFKELNQIANIMVQYQVSSPEKYGYWTSYVTARNQQAQGVGQRYGGRGM